MNSGLSRAFPAEKLPYTVAFASLSLVLAGCGPTAASDPAAEEAASAVAGDDATTGQKSASTTQWDGKKRRETDAIIVLELGGQAESILLNGEPADTIIDNKAKTAKVLIPSDETGISCENTLVVTFADAEKGQLLSNHCHGDETFAVVPGEINNALLTKEDVDNPADDDVMASGPVENLPLSHEWSANGFEQLPARYTWDGGKDDSGGAYAQLGVPETDDLVFSASCDGGGVLAYILLYDRPPEKGMLDTFKIEVEGKPVRSYEVYGLEYGEGVAFSLRLPGYDPMFEDLASGKWAYLQMGSDSGSGKIRVSLNGARGPIRWLMERC